MAQIGAVFVFCSSCKILYFASSVHPKNATDRVKVVQVQGGFRYVNYVHKVPILDAIK